MQNTPPQTPQQMDGILVKMKVFIGIITKKEIVILGRHKNCHGLRYMVHLEILIHNFQLIALRDLRFVADL